MSELDWIIKRAKETPSSQDYGIPDLPSSVDLPTEIDLIAKRVVRYQDRARTRTQNALSGAFRCKSHV